MIFVVARNINAFGAFCTMMSHAENGKCRHTGKVVYRYVHRPDILRGLDIANDSIYLAFGWFERADFPAIKEMVRGQVMRGIKVEGTRLEYIATQQRRNQHTGPRPRRYNGVRILPSRGDHRLIR